MKLLVSLLETDLKLSLIKNTFIKLIVNLIPYYCIFELIKYTNYNKHTSFIFKRNCRPKNSAALRQSNIRLVKISK